MDNSVTRQRVKPFPCSCFEASFSPKTDFYHSFFFSFEAYAIPLLVCSCQLMLFSFHRPQASSLLISKRSQNPHQNSLTHPFIRPAHYKPLITILLSVYNLKFFRFDSNISSIWFIFSFQGLALPQVTY